MKINSWDGLVYGPGEDSTLLLRHVRKYARDSVLDLGCGSGVQGISAALRGCRVICADLNPLALNLTKENAKMNGVKIETVLSDLFSNIEDSFDTIIFNPPYLPYEEPKYTDLMGGPKGNEITIKFLKKAKQHLNTGGEILLVISSLSHADETFNKICDFGYAYELLESVKFDWETIQILRLFCRK